jgi:HEAT repeat protein
LESAEPSIHVLAEAAVLLGKSRPSWAKDYLATLLPIAESWNDVLRVGVLDGIRELDDPSLADLCVEWTRDHRSEACRRAAAKALGRLGVRSSLAIQVLGELASTAPFLVKLSALDALAELGDPKGLGAIAKVLALPGDGRVRNHARAAQRAIERSSGLSARERSLQEDVMGLRNDNRALRERVERLEWLVNKAP